MARYDTTAFMAAVIRDAKIPEGSTYASADVLLELASDEMEALLVPELIKVTGGLLMAYEDTPLVVDQSRYRFPARAIRPERLQLVDDNGKFVAKLHPASGDMVDQVLAGRCPPGSAVGYWVAENNHAVLALQRGVCTTSGYSLRTYFRRQPNRLTATENCVQISNVTPNSGETGDATAFDWTKIRNEDVLDDMPLEGVLYDVVSHRPAFESVAEDIILQNVGSNDAQTLSSLTGATDGDFLAPAGYTPVPQLPVAFHPVLVAYTVARVCREMGNTEGERAALDDAARKLNTALTTITPRSEEAETAVNDTWL